MAVSTTAPPAHRESTQVRPSQRERIRAWLATPEAFGVACGIVAALPAFGVLLGLAQLHWVPTADNGSIAWRSWLVFTHRPPTVGELNLASRGGAVYDPGPMQYWATAPFVRVWPNLGPVVAMCVVGAASLIAGLVAVTQVAGRWLAAIVAGAALIGAWSAAMAIGNPVWNAYAPLLPFVGLLLVSWAVATGRLGWWPLLVLLASFCLQTHLSFGAASALLVVVAPACGVLARRRDGAGGRSIGRRWAVSGLVVGLLAWILPLYQELTNQPGNLTELWRSTIGSSIPHLGTHPALRLYGWSVGIPPLWIHGPQHSAWPFIGHAFHGRGTQVWAVVVLMLLAAALVGAIWRRLHDVVALTVVALVASVGALVSIHGIPTDRGVLTIGYISAVLYPVGFIVWLSLGFAAWRLVVQPVWSRWHARSGHEAGAPIWSARATGVACVAVLATLFVASIGVGGWLSHSAPHADDKSRGAWRDLAAVARRTVPLVENAPLPKGRVSLQLEAFGKSAVFEFSGIGYQLLTHGWTPTLDPDNLEFIRDPRFAAKPSDPVLAFVAPGAAPPRRSRRIGSVVNPTTGQRVGVYYRPSNG